MSGRIEDQERVFQSMVDDLVETSKQITEIESKTQTVSKQLLFKFGRQLQKVEKSKSPELKELSSQEQEQLRQAIKNVTHQLMEPAARKAKEELSKSLQQAEVYDKQGQKVEEEKGPRILLQGMTDSRFSVAARELSTKDNKLNEGEVLITMKNETGNERQYAVKLKEISDRLQIGLPKLQAAVNENRLSDFLEEKKPKLERLGRVMAYYEAMLSKYPTQGPDGTLSGKGITIQRATLMKIARVATKSLPDTPTTEPETVQLKFSAKAVQKEKYSGLKGANIYAQIAGGHLHVMERIEGGTVGAGNFGFVSKMKMISEGQVGVVKDIHPETDDKDEVQEAHEDMKNDFEIQQQLKGKPGIANAWALFHINGTKPTYVMAMPYAEGGDLKGFITGKYRAELDKTGKWQAFQEGCADDILTAIDSLHSNGIVGGGDIKLENILVMRSEDDPGKWDVILTDFAGGVIIGSDRCSPTFQPTVCDERDILAMFEAKAKLEKDKSKENWDKFAAATKPQDSFQAALVIYSVLSGVKNPFEGYSTDVGKAVKYELTSNATALQATHVCVPAKFKWERNLYQEYEIDASQRPEPDMQPLKDKNVSPEAIKFLAQMLGPTEGRPTIQAIKEFKESGFSWFNK